MSNIATNIFSQLSPQQLHEIKNSDMDIFGQINLTKYVTRANNDPDTSKFILDGFDLLKNIDKPETWKGLKTLVSTVVEIAQEVKPSIAVQFWVRVVGKKSSSINISFSFIEGEANIDPVLSKLEVMLKDKDEEYSKAKKGSIIWLAYDNEKQEWKETTL